MADDRSLSVLVRDWLLSPLAQKLDQMEVRIMAREDDNYAKLTATVDQVKTAFTSLRSENQQLRAALEQAAADQVAAVDAALAADSEHDADAIAAVEASLAEIASGQPVEVPTDPTA